VLVCAPTASGKTEAALAPLIERHLFPPARLQPRLTILYLLPTRALINDVEARLTAPLAAIQALRLDHAPTALTDTLPQLQANESNSVPDS